MKAYEVLTAKKLFLGCNVPLLEGVGSDFFLLPRKRRDSICDCAHPLSRCNILGHSYLRAGDSACTDACTIGYEKTHVQVQVCAVEECVACLDLERATLMCSPACMNMYAHISCCLWYPRSPAMYLPHHRQWQASVSACAASPAVSPSVAGLPRRHRTSAQVQVSFWHGRCLHPKLRPARDPSGERTTLQMTSI